MIPVFNLLEFPRKRLDQFSKPWRVKFSCGQSLGWGPFCFSGQVDLEQIDPKAGPLLAAAMHAHGSHTALGPGQIDAVQFRETSLFGSWQEDLTQANLLKHPDEPELIADLHCLDPEPFEQGQLETSERFRFLSDVLYLSPIRALSLAD